MSIENLVIGCVLAYFAFGLVLYGWNSLKQDEINSRAWRKRQDEKQLFARTDWSRYW